MVGEGQGGRGGGTADPSQRGRYAEETEAGDRDGQGTGKRGGEGWWGKGQGVKGGGTADPSQRGRYAEREGGGRPGRSRHLLRGVVRCRGGAWRLM